MSGGTKQRFKQFSITCAEDACLALGMLISGVSVNLDKYIQYTSEANALLASITEEEYVPAKAYDDVNDKLLYRQREILKYTADHQRSSFTAQQDAQDPKQFGQSQQGKQEQQDPQQNDAQPGDITEDIMS